MDMHPSDPKFWSAVRPPSRASPLPHFWIVGCQEESGWLSGSFREQARSHIFGSRGVRKRVVGCQGAFASKPAPTVGSRGDRQIVVGCQGAFAGKPAPTFLGRGVTGREWSAVGPPSRASPLPHFRIVGCQEESGWLSGRFRGQARSHSFGSRGVRKRVVGCRAAFAGNPAPTFWSAGYRQIGVGLQAGDNVISPATYRLQQSHSQASYHRSIPYAHIGRTA